MGRDCATFFLSPFLLSFYYLSFSLPFSLSFASFLIFFLYFFLIDELSYSMLFFSCKVVSDSFTTPWTVAHQAPLSMGFPRQEFSSGLPFPAPGDLPNPGIEPKCPALAGRFFTTQPPSNIMYEMSGRCRISTHALQILWKQMEIKQRWEKQRLFFLNSL